MNFDEVSFPGLGIKIDVNPVAFEVGGMKVYWYGIIIALAMITCFVLAVKQARKNNFSPDLVYDLMFVTVPCAVVGARIYYVIFKWDYYKDDLTKIFDTRSGGLAIYGGVISVLLGYYIMCRIRKIHYSTVFDYLAPLLPLGQAIGRWGNFFNQEAFGTTTSLPWGMTSPEIRSYLTSNYQTLHLDPTLPVHPTFLYESLGNIILCLILFYMRKHSKYALETSAVYFIGYGTLRFFVEGLRTDSLYVFGTPMRASQLLSVVLVIGGLLYIAWVHYKKIARYPLPERFLKGKDGKAVAVAGAGASASAGAAKASAESASESVSESADLSAAAKAAEEGAKAGEKAVKAAKDAKAAKAPAKNAPSKNQSHKNGSSNKKHKK